MKTLTKLSALILTMIIFSSNSGFAKTSDGHSSSIAIPTVQVMYSVVVHLEQEKTFCGVYQIELRDATGRQVAPAQVLVPGVIPYKFYEQTRQLKGVRIARLVRVPFGPQEICPNTVSAAPDVKIIEFKDGASYRFDLYPRVGPIKPISE